MLNPLKQQGSELGGGATYGVFHLAGKIGGHGAVGKGLT
jgi:hypothetical protein